MEDLVNLTLTSLQNMPVCMARAQDSIRCEIGETPKVICAFCSRTVFDPRARVLSYASGLILRNVKICL